ncbi:DNA replication and repair protein RecO [Desulfosporosinus acidiphilus SJ4]|uniref:DNA repair protein RecO n=1 Tax=Desulfosporosinus acidiphilus (strain DSM 22704 / JCM 16185 / SJ4) TaxID=646529 RepID=I4DAN7_DESAJ|nr:DNA repair protein RecO [Desulfosporosinus acidiphilus]AFM42861.1 DNA replication and repair protein RecO [Desulfosporosinus acidiphilus SJ4]
MAVYHADALVIRSREYGESDRVLTLFSRELGKLQAVAKGVRKPKSRQRAGAQLFTYGDFLIHKGKTLDTVSQCSPKESFSYLWTDLDRSLTATTMAELLDVSTILGQPNAELFTLTLSCLFLLEQYETSLLLSAYALRLLVILGYRPHLGDCVECGETLKSEKLFFSFEAGGTLCESCRKGYSGRILRAGSLAFMRQLIQVDLAKLERLRWSAWMREEILEILQHFLEYKFERPLKSWRMGNTISDDFGRLI